MAGLQCRADPCLVDLATGARPGFSILPRGESIAPGALGRVLYTPRPYLQPPCIFQKLWPQVQCVQSWALLTCRDPSLLSLRAVSFSTQ